MTVVSFNSLRFGLLGFGPYLLIQSVKIWVSTIALFFFFFEKVSTIAISIGKGRLDPRLEWTIQTTIFLFFLLTKNKRKKIEVMYTFFIL